MAGSCDRCPGVHCETARFFRIEVFGHVVLPGIEGRVASVELDDRGSLVMPIHTEPIDKCPGYTGDLSPLELGEAMQHAALANYLAQVSLGLAPRY